MLIKLLLGLALLAAPQMSYADWRGHHDRDHDRGRHYYHYYDHPRFGLRVSFIPDTCFSVRLRGARYYYYDGLYYDRAGADYVLISPPVGAVVRVIPTDYRPVVINGVTYYTDSGTYYVYTRRGYQVVPAPAPMVLQSPPPAPVQAVVDTDDAFTVNVPNSSGGYTPVLLKRSGKGFIGPQGEFYAEFPPISQLRAMYAK